MLKRLLIFVHRWLGVALCLIFLLWFPSGIGMMYWDFPSVSPADRLERSPALDPSKIVLSPMEAYERIDCRSRRRRRVSNVRRPSRLSLRRRAGRGGGGGVIVYADTGEEQIDVSTGDDARVAATWTGQPASAAQVEPIEDVDQWTVQGGIRNGRPLWKYSWPNGEQVYVSEATGEVVQYTTTASRLGAYVGAIPHWLYFTPLRKHGPLWSQVVIWSSGIGTVSAILGIVIGIWMYSPSKRYRYAGVADEHSVSRAEALAHGARTDLRPRRGHVGVQRHAVDGSVPEPAHGRAVRRRQAGGGPGIPQALRGRAGRSSSFAAKHPREALAQLPDLDGQGARADVVRRRAGLPGDAGAGRHAHRSREGRAARAEFDRQRIIDVVTKAAAADRGRGRSRDRSLRLVLPRSTPAATAARHPRAARTTPSRPATTSIRRRLAWSAPTARATG